jgi:hypothetical protein
MNEIERHALGDKTRRAVLAELLLPSQKKGPPEQGLTKPD